METNRESGRAGRGSRRLPSPPTRGRSESSLCSATPIIPITHRTAETLVRRIESSSTRASKSRNHSQYRRVLSPKTLTHGVVTVFLTTAILTVPFALDSTSDVALRPTKHSKLFGGFQQLTSRDCSSSSDLELVSKQAYVGLFHVGLFHN